MGMVRMRGVNNHVEHTGSKNHGQIASHLRRDGCIGTSYSDGFQIIDSEGKNR